jgi:hypothetical protein
MLDDSATDEHCEPIRNHFPEEHIPMIAGTETDPDASCA